MYTLFLAEPTQPTREAILDAFFGSECCLQQSDFDSYFEFYTTEVNRLKFGVSATLHSNLDIAVRSHEDIIYIAETLRRRTGQTRAEVRRLLQDQRFTGIKSNPMDRAVDLTLRLWLMLNVRSEDPLITPLSERLEWSNQKTLESFVARRFKAKTLKLQAKQSRLSHLFTVSFMVQVCGLKLEFTSTFEDHLKLNRRDKILRVFPHKAWLAAHLKTAQWRSKQEASLQSKTPYPRALLLETIFTLNMLFPDSDRGTDELLKCYDQRFHLQSPFDVPRTLDLKEFRYWGERLLELQEEIFLSPPLSWKQLWLDRRNPQLWSTFWTAQLIVAITLLSCILSGIQAAASIIALYK